MKIPHGKCLKLLKCIYGLKQASRQFNELVSSFLVSQGFTQCTTDTCLYFKMSDANIAIIGVYVDDILLCATTSAYADYLVGLMTVKFNVNDLGMRITISQDCHCIQLDLERYILNKITEYNFDSLSPLPTPMVHDIKLTDKDCPTTDAEKAEMAKYPFRSAISSLMFALMTMCVDISFPVCDILRPVLCQPWHAPLDRCGPNL
jgi:hypothetical protein